jgi:ribonucleotide monophosphatase NagD (HAD superfamily)
MRRHGGGLRVAQRRFLRVPPSATLPLRLRPNSLSLDARTADEVVMVGDDVEADVAGAMALGLAGILVQSGKYGAGDEMKIESPPTAVVADLSEAASWVLAQNR